MSDQRGGFGIATRDAIPPEAIEVVESALLDLRKKVDAELTSWYHGDPIWFLVEHPSEDPATYRRLQVSFVSNGTEVRVDASASLEHIDWGKRVVRTPSLLPSNLVKRWSASSVGDESTATDLFNDLLNLWDEALTTLGEVSGEDWVELPLSPHVTTA